MVYKKGLKKSGEVRRSKSLSILYLLAGLIIVTTILTNCGIEEGTPEPPTSPEISSITPNRGPAGTSVMIEGSGFNSIATENTVTFNGELAEVVAATPSSIEAFVPDSATTGPVAVRVGEEAATGPVFTVESQMPGIASIEPDSGTVGMEVLIHGMNFDSTTSGNIITFNGVEAPVNQASDTLLATEVPTGATTGPVEVTVHGETATGPEFTIIKRGILEVIVSTSGPEPAADGYLVSVEGAENQSSASNDTLYFSGLSEGNHEVELSDIAINCGVTGSNPRSISIAAGDTTTTYFEVFCDETVGALEVIVTTSGENQDADGYELSLDGEPSQSAATEDTLFYGNLSEGMHDIELFEVAGNCTVSGENPRMVDIVAGENTSVVLEVMCKEILENKIAFSSDRDGNNEIYVMNTDGTNQARLTYNAGSDENPAISPDGTRIAFDSDRDGNSDIYIMDSDGNNVVQITNSSALNNSAPAWSPDGNRLAFTRSNANQVSDIFVINVDGTGETNLTNNLESSDAGAAWSPDGSQIAFMSNRDDDANFEIFLINPDGTGLTQLTNTDDGISNANPDWSPDGSQIAFTTNRDQDFELYIMNADGSNPSRLTNTIGADLQPSFSPDGTNISFYSARDNNAEIYRVNVNGTGITNLTQNSANELSPDWSPVE